MEIISVDGSQVIVELVDFDTTKINEVILRNDDDTFTLLLNAKFNKEQLRDAYDHAIGHIRKNDFDKIYVQSIEAEAHNQMTAEEVCERLSKEAAERRRKHFERVRRKHQKKMAEREKFWEDLRHYSPDLYESHQEDLIYRF